MSDTDGIALVFNDGSTSLKVAAFRRGADDEELLLEGGADRIGGAGGSVHLRAADGAILAAEARSLPSQAEAMRLLIALLQAHLTAAPAVIGHRIVHGGPRLREHQRLTGAVLAELQRVVHLAPLHIPAALLGIRQTQAAFPGTLQIGCFDTAFHRSMPRKATRLAVPQSFDEQGVQRYGFHGLSCESVMHRLGRHPPERVVIAHLGGGSSVTAVQHGRSVDNSMGLSPTGGVPMATRSGDLDPAVLLFLLRSGFSAYALEELVNHECGLAGVAGGQGDMQELLRRSGEGDATAALAVDIFCTAVRKAIGGGAAVLGGVDLLVFTGGIGQHSAEVRSRIADGLKFCGLAAEQGRQRAMAAEEEIQIARHCRELGRKEANSVKPMPSG